ncbi:response regulator [Nitratireductor sp. XY-223]|uniref:response regulator n=1 Tax=Nitratireductor sp. XY-223 TaxID=2561926 RepID=UPI0010AA7F56|nr:response regulator [Nitratireductor sp. XY-223]
MSDTHPIADLIAVIDDDPDVRDALTMLLHDHGYAAAPFAGGHEFRAFENKEDVSLAIVDLRLNGESGLSLVQDIRASLSFPVIMLTGTGDEVDRIVGLETGADDYIMKPYSPRELIARIRAVLRRYSETHATLIREEPPHPSSVFHFGRYYVDVGLRCLFTSDGEEIPLTNSEFRLLEFFVKNPNRVIERELLLNVLGSDLSRYVDRTIDVLILRLRRKIEQVPSKPVHLQTRRGLGYIFVTDAG